MTSQWEIFGAVHSSFRCQAPKYHCPGRCHSFVLAWHLHREGTKLWHWDTTSHWHLLGTEPPQHIWHCNGTKRPQYWHCNGTGTPLPTWHQITSYMAPPWHLLGTIRAPCWHKKISTPIWNLSGTLLAAILFQHMNHQSQACSCNWRYSLTGEVFLVTALQAWLGPDYQTVCDYFYVKQLTTIEPN